VANWTDRPGTGNALGGKSGIYVVEACESDGSITGYRPAVGAILNIQRDHHELESLLPMFERFAGSCREQLIVNADCPNLARLHLTGLQARIVRFSTQDRTTALAAEKIELESLSSRFSVAGVSFACPLPGLYNVQNALAALALCEAAGVSRADFARILPSFKGVARRFQVVGKKRGVTVVDDFAHNPAKLAAVIGALNHWKGLRRKIVVFQPHGFGPAKFMRAELAETLAGCLGPQDLVILPEIYYAGGTASKDISSRDIVEDIKSRGVSAVYFERRAEAVGFIAGEAGRGDVVLVAGARDDSLTDFCREVLTAL
ncbi:MAG: cyanophycin synthetase, partial [Candidatus Glassbacteria bacterium]